MKPARPLVIGLLLIGLGLAISSATSANDDFDRALATARGESYDGTEFGDVLGGILVIAGGLGILVAVIAYGVALGVKSSREPQQGTE